MLSFVPPYHASKFAVDCIVLFERKKLTSSLFRQVFRTEIGCTILVNNLFIGGEKIASKFIRSYSKLIGKEYVNKVVGGAVRKIVELKLEWKPESNKKNTELLFSLAGECLESILSSMQIFPK